MQTNHPSKAPDYYAVAGDVRGGNRVSRTLILGREDQPNNYKLSYSQGGGENASADEWTTPRHHHDFEQIRHPLQGDYILTKDSVLPAGWVAYFPESAYYGPQAISPNLELIVVQLGGPSGNGFLSPRQRRVGFDALRAQGRKFEGGVCSWTDEQGRHHNQDGSEATLEYMRGKPVVYPEGRFRDLVLMNPAAFNWVKDRDQPKVARKTLGTFTEREISVGFIRLEKGATLQFGTRPSPETLLIKEGALMHDNILYPKLSAFGTDAEEAPVTLTCAEECELFYVKLPTF